MTFEPRPRIATDTEASADERLTSGVGTWTALGSRLSVIRGDWQPHLDKMYAFADKVRSVEDRLRSWSGLPETVIGADLATAVLASLQENAYERV